jgi:hypothetical protein
METLRNLFYGLLVAAASILLAGAVVLATYYVSMALGS